MPCRKCVAKEREIRYLEKEIDHLKAKCDYFKRQLLDLAKYLLVNVDIKRDDIAEQIYKDMDDRRERNRIMDEEEKEKQEELEKERQEEFEERIKEEIEKRERERGTEILRKEQELNEKAEESREKEMELRRKETELHEMEEQFYLDKDAAVEEILEEKKMNSEGECGISTSSDIVEDHEFDFKVQKCFKRDWTNRQKFSHLMAVIKHRHYCDSCKSCVPFFHHKPDKNPNRRIGFSARAVRSQKFYSDAQDFKSFLQQEYQQCCNNRGRLHMRSALYFCGDTYIHHMTCDNCKLCVVELPH